MIISYPPRPRKIKYSQTLDHCPHLPFLTYLPCSFLHTMCIHLAVQTIIKFTFVCMWGVEMGVNSKIAITSFTGVYLGLGLVEGTRLLLC
jgi:membrane associated rhomboid family serine protease